MKNFMELQEFITGDFCLTLKGIYNCNKREVDFLKKHINKNVHIYDIKVNDYLYVQSQDRSSILNLGKISRIKRNKNQIIIDTKNDKTIALCDETVALNF